MEWLSVHTNVGGGIVRAISAGKGRCRSGTGRNFTTVVGGLDGSWAGKLTEQMVASSLATKAGEMPAVTAGMKPDAGAPAGNTACIFSKARV